MEKSTATRSASDDRQAAANLAQRRQSGAGTAGALSDEVGQRTGAGFGAHSEKVAASQRLVDNSPRVIAQRKQIESAFGMPVQRQGSEEEELLQGKFATAQRQGPEEEELLQGKFDPLQRQGAEEEELLQGKFAPVQRQGAEEEELLQGKFVPVQRQEPDEEELLQGKFGAAQLKQETAPRANNTGLPDNLKAGIENLSGMSMDDVKVHYNSSQPAQLNALAYAQGTDIHVASGQEQHLPHEAWHVVQQAQGRVQPTMQMKDGVPVNDDEGLEREADVMGARALKARETKGSDHTIVSMVKPRRRQVENGLNESRPVLVLQRNDDEDAELPTWMSAIKEAADAIILLTSAGIGIFAGPLASLLGDISTTCGSIVVAMMEYRKHPRHWVTWIRLAVLVVQLAASIVLATFMIIAIHRDSPSRFAINNAYFAFGVVEAFALLVLDVAKNWESVTDPLQGVLASCRSRIDALRAQDGGDGDGDGDGDRDLEMGPNNSNVVDL